jgi:hypothetical protein
MNTAALPQAGEVTIPEDRPSRFLKTHVKHTTGINDS